VHRNIKSWKLEEKRKMCRPAKSGLHFFTTSIVVRTALGLSMFGFGRDYKSAPAGEEIICANLWIKTTLNAGWCLPLITNAA